MTSASWPTPSICGTIPVGARDLNELRAEGVASSRIEDVNAPVEQVLLSEAEAGTGAGAAAHVGDNLTVVEAALAHAAGTDPLTADLLHTWHRRLMTHGPLPEGHVGRWRSEVGWIGGASPTMAVFVPAPPDEVERLMDDLVARVNDCPWDPVTTTALTHAQFETIHPYADGNGRVGRVLALWVLARHLPDVAVPPPLSVPIARDTDAYIAALGAFRVGMDDHLVRWFAAIVTSASDASVDWAARLDQLVADWTQRTSDLRADAAARRMLPVLARVPVLSAEIAADELGVSLPAARNGLHALVDRDIVVDMGTVASGPGRPRRWWSAPELLDLVTGWTLPPDTWT